MDLTGVLLGICSREILLSTVRRNGLLKHATTLIHLKGIMLSQKNQSQKVTH